jgi:hypothetical protein
MNLLGGRLQPIVEDITAKIKPVSISEKYVKLMELIGEVVNTY